MLLYASPGLPAGRSRPTLTGTLSTDLLTVWAAAAQTAESNARETNDIVFINCTVWLSVKKIAAFVCVCNANEAGGFGLFERYCFPVRNQNGGRKQIRPPTFLRHFILRQIRDCLHSFNRWRAVRIGYRNRHQHVKTARPRPNGTDQLQVDCARRRAGAAASPGSSEGGEKNSIFEIGETRLVRKVQAGRLELVLRRDW